LPELGHLPFQGGELLPEFLDRADRDCGAAVGEAWVVRGTRNGIGRTVRNCVLVPRRVPP
jgi:hypothetical protein